MSAQGRGSLVKELLKLSSGQQEAALKELTKAPEVSLQSNLSAVPERIILLVDSSLKLKWI